jgi:hypothetical protein
MLAEIGKDQQVLFRQKFILHPAGLLFARKNTLEIQLNRKSNFKFSK